MMDELKFAAETPNAASANTWTVLVVDDDHEVHTVTKLALEEFHFVGRRLRFLHANSGAEARALLRQHPEIAIVLLDVVMETDRAGLDVVEFVRSQLQNRFIRVILRTGQPGQAPELEVITRYDINDYKYKTELTRERLFTTVYTALSTYRDLVALDANRRGLEKVIEATATLFQLDSIERFAQGVLEQLIALLFLERDAVLLHASAVAAASNSVPLRVVAATGSFQPLLGKDALTALPIAVLERIEEARGRALPIYGRDYFVGHDAAEPFGEWFYYVTADAPLGDPDRRLIELFCRNVALARRHVLLKQGPGAHA